MVTIITTNVTIRRMILTSATPLDFQHHFYLLLYSTIFCILTLRIGNKRNLKSKVMDITLNKKGLLFTSLLFLSLFIFWWMKSLTEELSTHIVLSAKPLQTTDQIINQISDETTNADFNSNNKKPNLKDEIEAAKGKLSKHDYKKVKSEYKQLVDHVDKLEKYKANPLKYDNKGFLKNAPNEQIRQQMIEGRILKLEREIQTFYNNIVKTLSTIQ